MRLDAEGAATLGEAGGAPVDLLACLARPVRIAPGATLRVILSDLAPHRDLLVRLDAGIAILLDGRGDPATTAAEGVVLGQVVVVQSIRLDGQPAFEDEAEELEKPERWLDYSFTPKISDRLLVSQSWSVYGRARPGVGTFYSLVMTPLGELLDLPFEIVKEAGIVDLTRWSPFLSDKAGVMREGALKRVAAPAPTLFDLLRALVENLAMFDGDEEKARAQEQVKRALDRWDEEMGSA